MQLWPSLRVVGLQVSFTLRCSILKNRASTPVLRCDTFFLFFFPSRHPSDESE